MRVARLVVVVCLSVVLSFSLFAQQPTVVSTPQPLTLLQNSLSALVGSQSVTDITLTGTARRIAGSDDESGTATLKALASGAARADFTFPSGARSELANLSATPPAGAWSGPDGISHPIAFHNFFAEPVWFFPAFAVARRLSTSGFASTYVAHETLNGQAVEHLSVSQTSSPLIATSDPLFPHLTQVDFYLDSTTLLPATITFNIHPDNNELFDIPVQVTFSDYRLVNGVQVPFHIQKFINNSLVLDFQAQSVTTNSGLSPSVFAAAAAPPGSPSVSAASHSTPAVSR
jgi:hypothetical protein